MDTNNSKTERPETSQFIDSIFESTEERSSETRKSVNLLNTRNLSADSFSQSDKITPKTFHRRYTTSKMRLPKRIILIRHGESLGNADESSYCRVPDWKIPLTKVGQEQAKEVGKKLNQLIEPNAPVTIYTSPYMRTKQTLALLLSELETKNILSVREEPRLTGKSLKFSCTLH